VKEDRSLLNSIPEPTDREFVAKVRHELADAESRAFEVMPLPEGQSRKYVVDGVVIEYRDRTKYETGRCKGCGIPWDEKTEGCSKCLARHYRREHPDGPRPSRPKGSCKGCGCAYSDHTDGCKTCWARHWMKRFQYGMSS